MVEDDIMAEYDSAIAAANASLPDTTPTSNETVPTGNAGEGHQAVVSSNNGAATPGATSK